MKETERSIHIIDLLIKEYPYTKYYLHFNNPLELLVAAILSAQVRDEVVNSTTTRIFTKYKTAADYANADLQEFINDIKPISFPSKKAENIIEACKVIVEKFKGCVPRSLDDLVLLPGIGRKTANTILSNAYDIVEGISCDTHCIRLSQRLGFSQNRNSDKIEKDLMTLIPNKYWIKLPHLLKDHGKDVCKAPTPFCSKCILTHLCPKIGVKKHH